MEEDREPGRSSSRCTPCLHRLVPRPLLERAELRSQISWRIVDTAWPQCLVNLCSNAISFTTVTVNGYLGTNELAGAAFANIVMAMTTVCINNGFGDGLITLASQAIGAGNPKLAGIWLQTAALCLCVALVPVAYLFWQTGYLLTLTGDLGPGDEVVAFAATFARWSILGLVPDSLGGVFQQWLLALKQVKPTIWIHCVFVFYNFFATLLFVRGIAGLGGFGFVGVPIALASTKFLRSACLVWYVCRVRQLHKEYLGPPEGTSRFGWRRIREFLQMCLPGVCAALAEQLQFVVVTIMIGTLGPVALAAHSGMLNVFGFLSCGMFAFADSGASCVGHYLGEGRPKSAQSAGFLLLLLMFSISLVVAAIFFFAEDVIGRSFSNDPAVVELAGRLSKILAMAYALLSLAICSFGILQGQGRPTIAAIAMLVGLWGISIPMAYLFGFVWPYHGTWGLVGVWWGLTCGYSTMTIVMASFVFMSPWQRLSSAAQARSGGQSFIAAEEQS